MSGAHPREDSSSLAAAARQGQFLTVLTREEATRRFRSALQLAPLGAEVIPLLQARGRILAEDVVAGLDVPGFDRSNVDGFALRSADIAGAMEEQPRTLHLNPEVLHPGAPPAMPVTEGAATTIATGGVLPRGADAVVMVEETHIGKSAPDAPLPLIVTRAASAGQHVTFAGTDIARGETILWKGQSITGREMGVLAAIGRASVAVYRRPRVAIISTGNEVVPPGDPLPAGCIYDSNAAMLAGAVEELGGEPVVLGAVRDDESQLAELLARALEFDCVLLSGGTSKGAGDLSYRAVSRLPDPGIVAHGVALKPGKPVCLAATQGKAVVVLPGFPTSAIFTFHEFVAPVIRALAGRPPEERAVVSATLPTRVNSDRGRAEYLLVGLTRTDHGFAAYPMGKGSGSVTTFSLADGFITIPEQTEFLDAGTTVNVTLLDRDLKPADLVVIGSHCVGLDRILGGMRQQGWTTKTMHVGSQAGLAAARRGECDVAGIHLLDPVTGRYNAPFLSEELELIPGYSRRQCLVFRADDPRFAGETAFEALSSGLRDATLVMVNRNSGSGTRIVIDELLQSLPSGLRRPAGYGIQPRSHNAVAAAIVQQRADWGVCIESVARDYGLAVRPLRDEHYDFVIPKSRLSRPAVVAFLAALQSAETQSQLRQLGFTPASLA